VGIDPNQCNRPPDPLDLPVDTVPLDSFSGVESAAPAVQVPKLVYYSFVTMTTLGYGDITPLKPATGTLAYLRS
jgi:hypothetical protein